MRLRSLASAAALILVAASSAFTFQGCGAQTEAMRCEVTDDCASGLTCTNVGFADKICCPERARATTSECKNGATNPADTGVADTAPPADTGATDGATDTTPADSAAIETSTDSGAADTATSTDAVDAG